SPDRNLKSFATYSPSAAFHSVFSWEFAADTAPQVANKAIANGILLIFSPALGRPHALGEVRRDRLEAAEIPRIAPARAAIWPANSSPRRSAASIPPPLPAPAPHPACQSAQIFFQRALQARLRRTTTAAPANRSARRASRQSSSGSPRPAPSARIRFS